MDEAAENIPSQMVRAKQMAGKAWGRESLRWVGLDRIIGGQCGGKKRADRGDCQDEQRKDRNASYFQSRLVNACHHAGCCRGAPPRRPGDFSWWS